MVRVLVGALLAAVILFAWGAVWWMALPFWTWATHSVPNDDAVVAVLQMNLPESGTYFSPYRDANATPEQDKVLMERHLRGPLVEIIYIKEGLDPMTPVALAAGFAQILVSTLVAGVLLSFAAPALPAYVQRVGFVLLLAIFAVVALNLADIVWFHHPWPYPAMRAAFVASGWLLAGLLMGAIIKAPAART